MPDRIGLRRICLCILNTENTKNSRSSTEKGDIALRVKRLNFLGAAGGTARPLPLETSVDSSCPPC